MEEVMTAALKRFELNHPTLRGKEIDPYRLPGRPGNGRMLDYLKNGATTEEKEYCRAGIEWSRKYPDYALPGFKRLMQEIRS